MSDNEFNLLDEINARKNAQAAAPQSPAAPAVSPEVPAAPAAAVKPPPLPADPPQNLPAPVNLSMLEPPSPACSPGTSWISPSRPRPRSMEVLWCSMTGTV